MLAIYQDKVEKDVCYETLSEDEPTVYRLESAYKKCLREGEVVNLGM